MHLVVFNYASFGLQSDVVYFIIVVVYGLLAIIDLFWHLVWCSIVKNRHSPTPTMAWFLIVSILLFAQTNNSQFMYQINHLSINQLIHISIQTQFIHQLVNN